MKNYITFSRDLYEAGFRCLCCANGFDFENFEEVLRHVKYRHPKVTYFQVRSVDGDRDHTARIFMRTKGEKDWWYV